MRISLNFSGGAELAENLRGLGDALKIRRALYPTLRVAAEPIRARAAELAPIDPATELDLKEGMVVSAATRSWEVKDEYQTAVAIGPSRSVFYGLMQEYGTVRHPAHSFLRPAFDYGTEATLYLMREGFWKLLEKANKGQGAWKGMK